MIDFKQKRTNLVKKHYDLIEFCVDLLREENFSKSRKELDYDVRHESKQSLKWNGCREMEKISGSKFWDRFLN